MTDLQQNKRAAIAFYRTAFEGRPREAVERYVGDRYIQHNPWVGDGPEAFVAHFDRMHEEYPDKRIEFVRAVAEGDLVAVHTHQVWPSDTEFVTMDFFRFDEQGKIIEHWDAVQEVPATSANPNTMY